MPKLLTKEDIDRILFERFKDDSCTSLSSLPSPSLFKDIEKSAGRVKEAILRDEHICIVGDYDVDGVISSFILSDFLDRVGAKNVEVIIPNRFEDGYGVSKDIVTKTDAPLIITVDNGILAFDAALECKKRGQDLIITDHHTPAQELPDAYSIINPKQKDCDFPFKEICGAEVAWYFAAAIKKKMNEEFDLSIYLDLLSIAIVADMMELRDLNRVLVKRGLKAINESKRAAILSIKEYFKKESFGSEDISFLLSPLLNSSGRMQSADISLKFLRSKTLKEAGEILQEIVSLNEKRKEIEKELFEISKEMVDENDKIVVVWGENWHEGVIGIVAARLAKNFLKPAIVFSINENIAKGSARSVGDIDILSLITKQKELLIKYGGHKGAAGLSIYKEKISEFKKAITKDVENIEENLFESEKEILGEIDAKEIDFELLEILENYEPYGQKNPKPYFTIKNITVKKERLLGRDKNHQKIILQTEDSVLESINFNFKERVNVGERVDMLFTISKNIYRGYVTPQLLVENIKNRDS